ncbi:disease resistance protein Roq1-like [Lycium ferocissimum]|uniref:disease resistance protein Roq1-like n=1 Tax=Lycium ferocissimum TaxID=112874 RepID=UPI0028166DB8|nr:disease resistance protein Roq1-like [Lycium ferocissimum]
MLVEAIFLAYPKVSKNSYGLRPWTFNYVVILMNCSKSYPQIWRSYVHYHLALKSIRDLVIKYLKLRFLSISWCGHEKSEYRTVSLQHLIRTCIQCDFQQRDYFLISFPKVRIPELFDYQFINQKEISIDLNPSWYTDKFMGFSICGCPDEEDVALVATLVCKSDPERKHSLEYDFPKCWRESAMCFIYIPFETLWHASDNKEGKNPNDYYIVSRYRRGVRDELCWEFAQYESKNAR